MIEIKPSPTADSRTCDVSKVSQATLLKSSHQHIKDVQRAMAFFAALIQRQAVWHDEDKIGDIETFHRDFKAKFATTDWWDNHRGITRHHINLPDGVPPDVNLVDVIEYICDCVCAGLARSGTVYKLQLDPGVLQRAFDNTVDKLMNNIRLKKD